MGEAKRRAYLLKRLENDTANPDTAFNLAKMVEILNAVGPEPIGEWMREQGYPPEHNFLVLPTGYKEKMQLSYWPSYVSFSDHLDYPVLCRKI
jgi:hypothetical protein